MTEQDVFDMAREVCGKWPSFMSNPNLQAFAKRIASAAIAEEQDRICRQIAALHDSIMLASHATLKKRGDHD